MFHTQEQEARTAILRNRARARQGIKEEELPVKKELTGTTETRYEVVFRNGACVSVPITEEKNLVQFTPSGHVNFFANLEDGGQAEGVANKEHEQEKKKEQEDYEKQIGLLTYLGQGSKESSGESSWYEKPSLLRSLQQQAPEEVNHKTQKAKDMFDPIRVIRHYIGKPEPLQQKKTPVKPITANTDLRFPSSSTSSLATIKSESRGEKRSNKKSKKEHKKSKKRKRSKSRKRSHSSESDSSRRKSKKSRRDESSSDSSSSDDSDNEKKKKLEILRAKRLQREKQERAKTNKLLASIHGTAVPQEKRDDSDGDRDDPADETLIRVKPKQQKYHSQYNPELAKQNAPLDSSTKYWLQ